jgi:hypothetical protein
MCNDFIEHKKTDVHVRAAIGSQSSGFPEMKVVNSCGLQ